MEGVGKGWRKIKGCRGAPAAPLNALIRWSGAYRHQEQGSGPCQMIPRQTRRQTLVLEIHSRRLRLQKEQEDLTRWGCLGTCLRAGRCLNAVRKWDEDNHHVVW